MYFSLTLCPEKVKLSLIKMKISKLIIASIVYFLTISITPSFASEEKHGEKNFNAGELIMEHIADEHGWHLWGHTTLPLPVILYNSDSLRPVDYKKCIEHFCYDDHFNARLFISSKVVYKKKRVGSSRITKCC